MISQEEYTETMDRLAVIISKLRDEQRLLRKALESQQTNLEAKSEQIQILSQQFPTVETWERRARQLQEMRLELHRPPTNPGSVSIGQCGMCRHLSAVQSLPRVVQGETGALPPGTKTRPTLILECRARQTKPLLEFVQLCLLFEPVEGSPHQR